MLNRPRPYFRQRKAKVVPFATNVIPINHRSAFNPAPLLPKRLLPLFEANLFMELSYHLGETEPVPLMARLCLAYRPSARMDSTAALAWARLLAKDLRWRVYEGTYEYIVFNGHFVKLIDKGISVQSVLLAWIRNVSELYGDTWLWKTKDELEDLLKNELRTEPHQRLRRAWLEAEVWWKEHGREEAIPIVRSHEDCPALDRMDEFRDLVIREQLARIAPRVEQHLTQN